MKLKGPWTEPQISKYLADTIIPARIGVLTSDGAPLVLDFSQVPYISSVGLRVLMLASRRVNAQQGKLAMAALTPLVAEVFRISRFDMVLRVFDTVDAAVTALQA